MPTGEPFPRLFVALPLPEPIKQQLGSSAAKLKLAASFRKWTHPADLHITLKFLGGVDPALDGSIDAALGKIAARGYPFELRLAGFGTFGLKASPRVLWASVDGNLKQLNVLQADVESEISPLGFPAENRPYAPHVTIARQYSGSSPFRLDAVQSAFPFQAPDSKDGGLAWTVDRIVLYRSHLGRSPMYEPIRTYPFHAGG